MTSRARIAAELHKHLCQHDWHGYDQNRRWGDGEGTCSVSVDGVTYEVEQGDRDCSSSIIECWRVALKGTPYEGKLDKATYTGNMRDVFVKSGLFEWKPMSFVAQTGDIYLNERDHTAMCQSAIPDMLSEFCIAENGGIFAGQVGDQSGRESWIHAYYDYPWNGILHYNGKADTDKVGWYLDNKGWWYRNADGSYPKSQWLQLDAWYWFDATGYAVSGWQTINGEKYFFDSNCRMQTGWVRTGGRWYYLNDQGQMVKGCILKIDGENYAFGPDGSMKQGSLPISESGAIILD